MYSIIFSILSQRESRPLTNGCQMPIHSPPPAAHGLEFGEEGLHGAFRRHDLHHVVQVDRMNVGRPVVGRPAGRKLDQLALVGLEHIGHVIAHQR